MIRNTTQDAHFNITSTSANVQDLTEQVQSGFENADLVLVQANGLRFEDDRITRVSQYYHQERYLFINN